MDNIVNCFYEVEDSFHSLNGNSKGMLVVVQSGAGTRFFFGNFTDEDCAKREWEKVEEVFLDHEVERVYEKYFLIKS